MSQDSLESTSTTTPSRRRWLTLCVVGLAQLMVVLDTTVVNIALPSAQADLGFSDGDRQWVITAYALAFGSLLLLGGRLSDLIGRRRTLVTGLIGFAAASALGGAATSFGMLVGARALQGVFGALLAPAALAVLTTTFTVPKERARAFGVFGAIAGAGGAVGLLLGGFLTQQLDWRWSLYINTVIAAVAIIGAFIFVPAIDRTASRTRLDMPGALLVSGGLFGLVYGFSNAESQGWDSAPTWMTLALAGVLLVAFVMWQRRAAHPLLPLTVLLNRNRAAGYVSVFMAAIGMFSVFLFVTYFLQVSLGFSPIQTGLSFLPMVGMLVLAAQLGTNVLVPRLGPKVMVPTGMLLGVVAMVYLTNLELSSTYVADVLPALMIMGAAMGTIVPAAMQSATLGVEGQHAGVASALVNTSQQVGGAIGTALLNTLAATAVTDYLATHARTPVIAAEAAVHSYTVAYWWCAAFFAVGGIVTGVMFRRRGQEPSSAHAAEPALPG
ncbi:MAG: MFS transporter [Actinomycetia bacterium]|nr:MFS transporter [Actinomycetes bacterium]